MQTDRQTDRQRKPAQTRQAHQADTPGRQAGRQISHRQANQTDRQTERQAGKPMQQSSNQRKPAPISTNQADGQAGRIA